MAVGPTKGCLRALTYVEEVLDSLAAPGILAAYGARGMPGALLQSQIRQLKTLATCRQSDVSKYGSSPLQHRRALCTDQFGAHLFQGLPRPS
jgi:hypothetical protein